MPTVRRGKDRPEESDPRTALLVAGAADQAYVDEAIADPDGMRAALAAGYANLLDVARDDFLTFCELVLRDEKTAVPIELQPYQEEYAQLVLTERRLVLWAHVEGGKAVPLDTPIPTPSGWTTMGALCPGDTVFGQDGLPCSVRWCSAVQHDRPVYELTFDDGQSVRADADHQWVVEETNHGDGRRRPLVMTTKALADTVLSGCGRTRWRIPLTAPVQYPELDLPVPPYVLGAWLGDGDSQGPVLTFHKDDRAVYDRCVALLGFGTGEPWSSPKSPNVFRARIGSYSHKEPGGRGSSERVLMPKLRTLGVLNNKHIPDAYLQASEAQRRELLAGLLDTDGSIKKTVTGSSLVEFCVCNKALAEGALELVRSLGFKARLKASDAKLNGRVVNTRYRLTFTARVPVFHLPRKRDAQRLGELDTRANYRYIKAIKPVESVLVRCIAVDSPDHTYLMHRDYTVTHNSQIITIGYVLWRLGRDPNLRVVIISNTADQATKLVRAIRTYIEKSEALHAIFPELLPGPTWADTRFTVKRTNIGGKDYSVQGCGVHGNVHGNRTDLAIFDDVLDYENTLTEDAREETLRWCLATPMSRLSDESQAIFLGNAWHRQDMAHALVSDHGWYGAVYGILDDAGESRWPSRFPPERIAQLREDFGPLEFARMYLCDARSDASSRFELAWIETAFKAGKGETMLYQLERVPPGAQSVTGIDLATVQGKRKGARTVFSTILAWPGNRYDLVNIEGGQFGAPKILELAVAHHSRYFSKLVVESNACFVPGTRVLTQHGYRAIESIAVGDVVLTHRGVWRPVTAVMRRAYAGRLVTMRAASGLAVLCTPEHPFWLRDAGRVLGARGAADVGKHRPVGEPAWRTADDVCASAGGAYTALPLPVWPVVAPVLDLTRYSAKLRVEVDDAWALFLGLYLAEGSHGTTQVSFALHERETHLCDHVAQTAQRLGASTTVRAATGRGIAAIVNFKPLARLLDLCGRRDTKCLPWPWMGWPLRVRLGIVRGWLMGDGCLRLNNKSTGAATLYMSGSTISRDLLLQMRVTLLEAGLRPAVTRNQARRSCIGGREVISKPSYMLSLNGDDTRALLSLAVSAPERAHWRVTPDRERRASGTQIVLEPGVAWSRLREPVFSDYAGDVCNLEVAGDNSYVVEDMAVHNCQLFITQMLQDAGMRLPVEAFYTGKNRHDPQFGVESLAGEMASGKWSLPSIDGTARKAEEPLRRLVADMVGYSPLTHTGDYLSSLWIAREGSRQRRASIRVGNVRLSAR